MINKNKLTKILIAIIVIIVAVVAIVFLLQASVDNDILSTKLAAGVQENNTGITSNFEYRYSDVDNGVYYDFSMAKNFDDYKKLLQSLNAKKIEDKMYNDIKWEIYYFNPSNLPTNYEYNNIVGAYILFTSTKNGEYLITISTDAVLADNTLTSNLFTKFVLPVLENMNLKDPQNPPTEFKLFNTNQSNFDSAISSLNSGDSNATA
ncbi:MAG: hypothetical protein LBM96_11360 [Methanobrevibacter sp.]|jgi:hypothetical protein|nr:hypothetical protein [Candidatus Methanoflexus mossambicus]